LSAKGALICNEGQSFTVPGRAVTAVDTNGAGDAFAGAFLYALNAGLGWKVAAELAILISSQVVSQFGPRLAIADYAALLENFQKECA
jgi:sugar/nucleoside kinase (ribokinase family)